MKTAAQWIDDAFSKCHPSERPCPAEGCADSINCIAVVNMIAAIRAEAFNEAATLAKTMEFSGSNTARDIASAIRALATKEPA